jgi:hypothetical protein
VISRATRGPSRDFVEVAWSLLLDHATTQAIARLESRGIPCLLLKGVSIATWLYEEGAPRPYRDIDLLVPAERFEEAVTVLGELGYANPLAGADPCEYGPNELALVDPRGACVDLHHALIGVVEPARAWDALLSRSTWLQVGGSTVRVLDVAARAMHLALHAIQDGPVNTKAIEDLSRGVELVPLEQWREAAALADELSAGPAFAAGLRLIPEGRVLADELGLPKVASVDLAMRARSAPPEAFVVEQLTRLPDLRSRADLLRRKLFPTAVLLRSEYALARRGRMGLLAARIWRIYDLVRRFPPGLAAWLRARRDVRRRN